MTTFTDAKQLIGDFPIFNARAPDKAGPRALPYYATLAANVPYMIDLKLSEQRGVVGEIQTLFVDNRAGLGPLRVQMEGSNQVVIMPAGEADYVPVLVPTAVFTLTREDAGQAIIFFINVPIPPRGVCCDAFGLVSYLAASAATTNPTLVKSSAGRIGLITGYNSIASILYLHLYDLATLPVTGTSVAVRTLPLPPQQSFAYGLNFLCKNGIGYSLQTGAALNGNNAVALNDIVALAMEYQ